MKKYIGTKVVEAEPSDARPELGPMSGYEVVYEDGYRSWSPKATFEECYFEILNPADTEIMRFFSFDHLPLHLQKISKPFCLMANFIHSALPHNAERTTALRKLLESKDAAVRANI
ncbi:MAG: hypothetical protein JKY67_08440 [Pseudomonadales bacterium]|nr:hypothetical protein [Pseudomonadales bacterium]